MARRFHNRRRPAALGALGMGLFFLMQPALAVTYEYDDLGRLKKVIYDDGSHVTYQYDAAGNRTAVTTVKI